MRTPSVGDRPRLGVDCDGVIANFSTYVLRRVNRTLQTHHRIDDWWTYDAAIAFGPEVAAICRTVVSEAATWRSLPVYPTAPAQLRALADHYDLYVTLRWGSSPAASSGTPALA